LNKKKLQVIIGSDGLIGQKLSKNLKSENIITISKKKKPSNKHHYSGNIENLNFLKKTHNLLKKKKIKKIIVYYLAGHSRARYNKNKLRNILISTTKKLTNILETFKGPNVKIILCSSGSVYAPNKTKLNESSKVKPLSLYSNIKLLEENIALEYARNLKTKIVIGRIFSIYAPNAKNFFINDAKSKMKSNKTKITFNGSGKQARDYLHLNDVCEGLKILSVKGKTNQIYNICSGKFYYLKEILSTINKTFCNNSKTIFWNNDNEFNENDFWYGSNNKIKKLGFHPYTLKLKDFLN